MADVVFDSENDLLPKRGEGSRLPPVVHPLPPKRDNKPEVMLASVLGLVLVGSVYVAVRTQPKPIEVPTTPSDANVVNPAITEATF